MKKICILFLFIISFDVKARSIYKTPNDIGSVPNTETENLKLESRPFFKRKDLEKPKNIIVNNDFDITYSLLIVNEDCIIPIEIKNISKDEKRNTFSIVAYSYADKKYESFITEKRSKPGEIVSTQIIFEDTDCHDIKKINFYR